MADTYKSRYGLDWPKDASETFIKLFVAKKWREILRDRGVEVKDPWVPLLEACVELFGDGFKVHKWAEEHAHDWVTEQGIITWACASAGKSSDTGCFCVLDWIVDPTETTILIGSTTKEALRKRTWESVERYFDLLQHNDLFTVPGKITETGYAILNRRDDDSMTGTKGAKAGIHGVALNDGGTLQGAHSRYVRLVIDELA
ncbi:MAG: hypothetical protein IKC14_08970, partial [Kiritimatiellae bacterium]|nr:hypothetical protein [Kiritimatiellia bacterium]